MVVETEELRDVGPHQDPAMALYDDCSHLPLSRRLLTPFVVRASRAVANGGSNPTGNCALIEPVNGSVFSILRLQRRWS